MKLRTIAASLATVALAIGAPVAAHDINPFICGNASNAKSAYVTVTGQLVNDLTTQSKGTAIPGFTMSNIDSGDGLGQSSLVFNYFGTPNKTNGPYVFINAHDGLGNQYSGSVFMGNGHVSTHNTTYTTFVFGYSDFKMPRGALVDLVVVQIYPSSKAFEARVYSRFNGATFNKLTTVLSECPAGTTVP